MNYGNPPKQAIQDVLGNHQVPCSQCTTNPSIFVLFFTNCRRAICSYLVMERYQTSTLGSKKWKMFPSCLHVYSFILVRRGFPACFLLYLNSCWDMLAARAIFGRFTFRYLELFNQKVIMSRLPFTLMAPRDSKSKPPSLCRNLGCIATHVNS